MLQTDEATAQHRRDLIARYPLVQYVPIEERNTRAHSISRPLTQFLPVYLEDYQARCDICLADFSPLSASNTGSDVFEPLTQLPCAHVFHATCIGQWLVPDMSEDISDVDLVSRNYSCPSCRADIQPEASTKHSNSIDTRPEDGPGSADEEHRDLNMQSVPAITRTTFSARYHTFCNKILQLVGRRR